MGDMKTVVYGEAVAFGAASIINAIALGCGATFGVDLKTEARVTLTTNSPKVSGKILGDPTEDKTLLETAPKTVLRCFGLVKKYGAYVETESEIPIARGMKSSSVAANAIVLATLAAIGKNPSDNTVLNLSVKAALEAKTSITGAYDDACASYFGGVVITNNKRRTILKRGKMPKRLAVLFHIPPQKSYTHRANATNIQFFSKLVKKAFEKALENQYLKALTMNGIIHSVALGLDGRPAIAALNGGAEAAGISGKGPATVVLVGQDRIKSVLESLQQFDGKILATSLNTKKSYIVRSE